MKLILLDPQTREVIAQLHLNGHNIEPGGPLGQAGAMRSFTLLEGSVFTHWSTRQPLILKREYGREALVRVSALPAEEGETGFIEFL